MNCADFPIGSSSSSFLIQLWTNCLEMHPSMSNNNREPLRDIPKASLKQIFVNQVFPLRWLRWYQAHK